MHASPRARLGGSLLALLGITMIVAAAAAWLFWSREHVAFALLKVSARQPSVLGKADASEEFRTFKRTQVQLLTSHMVLNGALRDRKIHQLPLVAAHAQDPVGWLKDSLFVDYPDDAEIMRISMSGPDSEDLLTVLDKVVETYLKEIVQTEKQRHIETEQKLKDSYASLSAEYEKELNALRTLENIHKTSGSEAAQMKKKMAIEELNGMTAERNRLRQEIRQVQVEIGVIEALADTPPEKKTADPAPAVAPPTAKLAELQARLTLLQKQYEETDVAVAHKAQDVGEMESFSAQVAGKQESLQALRAIKTQLGAELDKMRVERLAPERITLIDKAVMDSSKGEQFRHTLGEALVAGVGLLFIGFGMVIRRPGRADLERFLRNN